MTAGAGNGRASWPTIALVPTPIEKVSAGDVIALPSGSRRVIAQTVDYPGSTAGEHVVPPCTVLVYTNGHQSRGYQAGETVPCERWTDVAA